LPRRLPGAQAFPTQQLRERLHAATATLAVRAERLEPFIEDVARARTAPLLTLADLQGDVASQRALTP
jgi:hypothetical protein